MIRMMMTAAVLALCCTAVPIHAQQAKAPARSAAKPMPDPSSPLNLNTATQAQLEALPGIGASTAARILEYRQKNGAFKKVEDLMNVQGVGEKSFLKLKPLITVSSARATP